MSETIVGNMHMSTRLFGHDCTFTLRLRNLSLLKHRTNKIKPIVKHQFTLHPKCDTSWRITICSVPGGYEAHVSTKMCRASFVTTRPYIGLLDPNGDLVLPNNPDKSDKDCDVLFLKMKFGEGNTVKIGLNKVVELKEDTLVVSGRVALPMCCTRTEIDKEETSVVPKNSNLLEYLDVIQDGFEVA